MDVFAIFSKDDLSSDVTGSAISFMYCLALFAAFL
jgi:hypothetical protein